MPKDRTKDQAMRAKKVITSQHLRSIIDNMPNMIGYWDKELRCRYANNIYEEWFEKQPQDLIGIQLQELMGHELFSLNTPHIRNVLSGEQQRFERTLHKANGEIGHIIGHYIPDFDDEGSVRGFAILASEVTDLKEMEEKLKLAACVFDNTADGVLITDIHGTILSVNPAFVEITGYTAEEAIGQNPRILQSDQHEPDFYASMWNEIQTNGQWNSEIWNRRKDGDLYLQRIAIRMVCDEKNNPIRYVSVFSDITDLWHKDQYIKHLAFHDALTNLPNRAFLMEQLDQNLTHAKLQHRRLALIFLDLDGFKPINDQFGHKVGDEVLKEIGKRLMAMVRQSDTVARVGGDEFIFILNDLTHTEEIRQISHRIIQSISTRITVNEHRIHIGASIGVAVFPDDGLTSFDLINNADSAMYVAKGSSDKNKVHFFSPQRQSPF
jgi:diguanylate cyclase (GGDEF)-like protein/PAS domain S-box-containing protein